MSMCFFSGILLNADRNTVNVHSSASEGLSLCSSLLFPVDFLAKYCIFSQEKLAEYKRAFEAVSEKGLKPC